MGDTGTCISRVLLFITILTQLLSLGGEQFHDADFLSQLDTAMMKDDAEIIKARPITVAPKVITSPPTYNHKAPVTQEVKDSPQLKDKKKKGKQKVSPCFQHRRQSFLAPVMQEYTKRKM